MGLSKVPKWVLIGAGILALVSGLVNAIALLGFTHHGATHMTGLFSAFSIAAFQNKTTTLFEVSGILFSFFAGSVVTGLILRDAHLKMGQHYGTVMILEGILLVLSTLGFYHQLIWGEYAAAMAAGLQNAMASMYSGAIIRTTHLTGVLTDLGVLLGHRLIGIRSDKLKIKLFMTLIFTFIAGGFLGTWFYALWGPLAMLVPAMLVFFCAVSYRVLRKMS